MDAVVRFGRQEGLPLPNIWYENLPDEYDEPESTDFKARIRYFINRYGEIWL